MQHRFSNKDLRKLIIPLFLEQLLMQLVGVADTFMITFAGDSAVSGVSLVNMFVTFFIYVFSSLAAGGAVLISQFIGRKDRENAERTAGQLMTISVLISVVCTAVVIIWNEPILHLLFGKVEPDVMAACVTYQSVMAYSFVFLGIYNTGAAICRSINRTNVTLVISLISNIVNIAGNAIGIFVLKAGVAGVAWPTFIARVAAAAAVFIFCLSEKNEVVLRFKYIFAWMGRLIKRILYVAIPNSVENGIFQIIKIALSSVVALFGTAQIAANGIAQTIWALSAMMSMAMGPAFITVIGQCMGAGDVSDAEYYFKKLLKIALVASTIWNALIFGLTPLLMRMYPVSGEIKQLVIWLVLIHNAFSAFVWPFGASLPNGLRAAGDVRFPMIISVASTALIRLPFSIILGITLNMGVLGIAWAMVSDWTVRAIIFTIRYKKGRWKSMKII